MTVKPCEQCDVTCFWLTADYQYLGNCELPVESWRTLPL